jgi:hypothetical protein
MSAPLPVLPAWTELQWAWLFFGSSFIAWLGLELAAVAYDDDDEDDEEDPCVDG